MDIGTGTGRVSLLDRAKAIILSPKEEWPRIEAEPTSQTDILKSYVLPLAAIGPVATFIGGQIFGFGAFGFSYRPGLISSLVGGIIQYAVVILGVFVLTFIADFLAPKFDGQSNRLNAFKLVAYSATAAWLAQIFGLIPQLGFFSILGLYSIYLFYVGAIPLMKVPEDKAVGYVAVTFVCALIGGFVLSLIIAPITLLFAGIGGGATLASSDSNDGTLTIPGVGSMDTGKMQEAADRMERMQKGELKPVGTDTLRQMLPETIGQFTRTGVSTQAIGAAGSGVEGSYKGGDYQFDLRINDMLGLSGLAGLGSALGIEQSKEDENGYERIGTSDGQWRSEKWNTQSNSGSYGILVADRFQVEASGNVPSIDVLKAAVAKIDDGDLEDLAE